ncbi:MAG: hypothetical protein P8R42_10090 [Candidatus Binatia bacterium]|nr:hypothetical protein [Candidatus Binatia bacterium]
MFAIAVADASRLAGKTPVIVIAHDAESMEHFRRGQFHLYHVAIEVDGILCDARGRIQTDDEILSFMTPPVPQAKVDRFAVDADLKSIIRRKTRWTISFEKYADEATRLIVDLS